MFFHSFNLFLILLNKDVVFNLKRNFLLRMMNVRPNTFNSLWAITSTRDTEDTRDTEGTRNTEDTRDTEDTRE